MAAWREVFSAKVGGKAPEDFNFNVGAGPTDIPRTTNPATTVTIYENAIPHAIIDPQFIGINVTKGDLGDSAYLVHVDFDVFQSTGGNRTYTLHVFRGSSGNPGGIALPNQSAGRLTVPTVQSGEWGASWIIAAPAPGLSTNNAIRVQLAADMNHAVQFQGCRFRIERLGN